MKTVFVLIFLLLYHYHNTGQEMDVIAKAAGAFLVSSKRINGNVAYLHILSEKGSLCKLKNPWGKVSVQLVSNGKPSETLTGEMLTFKTAVNEKIKIKTL
jgi:hypothetical protein